MTRLRRLRHAPIPMWVALLAVTVCVACGFGALAVCVVTT